MCWRTTGVERSPAFASASHWPSATTPSSTKPPTGERHRAPRSRAPKRAYKPSSE